MLRHLLYMLLSNTVFSCCCALVSGNLGDGCSSGGGNIARKKLTYEDVNPNLHFSFFQRVKSSWRRDSSWKVRRGLASYRRESGSNLQYFHFVTPLTLVAPNENIWDCNWKHLEVTVLVKETETRSLVRLRTGPLHECHFLSQLCPPSLTTRKQTTKTA